MRDIVQMNELHEIRPSRFGCQALKPFESCPVKLEFDWIDSGGQTAQTWQSSLAIGAVFTIHDVMLICAAGSS